MIQMSCFLFHQTFFLVRSDSDESIFNGTGINDQKNEIERMVMNNLVSQVNELESRISVIEDRRISNSQKFNLFTSSESDNLYPISSDCNTMSKNAKKLSNSYDNMRNSSATPLKVQHHHSFPSTPSASAYQGGSSSFSTPQSNTENRQYAMSVQSLTPSEEDFICPPELKLFSKSSDTPSKKCDRSSKCELMNEIDDFLLSVKKNPSNIQEQAHISQQDSSEKMSLSNDARRFDLKGIDHLLDEMEATEIEIYRKLQPQNVVDNVTDCRTYTQETVNGRNIHMKENIEVVRELRSDVKTCSNSGTPNSTYSSEERDVMNKMYVTEKQTNVFEHVKIRNNDKETRHAPNIPDSLSTQNPLPKKRLEFGNEHVINEDFRMPRNSLGSNSESLNTLVRDKMENGTQSILPNRRGFARGMSPVKTDIDPSSGSTSSYGSNRSIVTCIPNTETTRKYGWKNSQLKEQTTNTSATNKQKDMLPESAVPRQSRQLPYGIMNERSTGRAKTSSCSDDTHMSERTGNNGDSNLVSLVNLWGSEEVLPGATSHNLDKGRHNPTEKLKEEHYRRQHCEQQILQLQAQLLEAQQKLAVAWEVDRAKDKAIFRLQEAWNKLVAHWKDLEEQRHNLTRLLHDERESFRKDMSEASQNVKRYEAELSKMLDLAKGYKEKSETAEKDKEEMSHKYNLEILTLKKEIEEKDQKLLCACQDISSLQSEREELLKGLVRANQNIQEEQKINKNAQEDLEEVRDVLSSCEAELLALKEEKSSLQLKNKEEKNRIIVIEQQKQSLQISVNEAKKREKSLEAELESYREKMEKLKVELRDYYQKQVEDVVKEKLKEFQDQLDAADASFKNDLESREKAVADLAARQIKEISDKHQLEVRLLEEKHMEKQQLLKLQLNQAAKYISQLKSQVDYFTTHRNDLVEKLHNMMEAQWQQAMGILSNAGIQIPSQMCHSSQPMYISKDGNKQPDVEHSQVGQHYHKGQAKENVSSPLQPFLQHSAADIFPLRRDQRSLSQDSQLTYNVASTDQTQNLIINHGDKLREYIEMLLQRTPGSPVTDNPNIPTTETGKTAPFLHWKDIIDNNKFQSQQIGSSEFDVLQTTNTGSNKDTSRLVKRPWK